MSATSTILKGLNNDDLDVIGCWIGAIIVVGKNAQPVLTYQDKHRAYVAIAAGERGQGRVVVFSHYAYINLMLNGDRPQLKNNCMEWVTRGNQSSATVISAKSKGPLDQLNDCVPESNVLILNGSFPELKEYIAQIVYFVEQGGSLIFGTCPWHYLSENGGTLKEMPAQILLSNFGMAFTDSPNSPPYYMEDNKAAEAHFMSNVETYLIKREEPLDEESYQFLAEGLATLFKSDVVPEPYLKVMEKMLQVLKTTDDNSRATEKKAHKT